MNNCARVLAAALAVALVGRVSAAIRTEKLAEDIYRVRMDRNGVWPDSLMNRYGVVENLQVRSVSDSLDFGAVKAEAKHVGKGFELRFPLAKGEHVYGLGDCNRDCLDRRGGRFDIWVANVTSYIPVPMAMTSRGWGVFVNTSRRHTFDVGKTDPDALVITAETGEVDFYVFTGKDYRALLDAYTRITGRPALLPAFAFGFAYVANQWIEMFAFTEEAYRFRELDLPCDIVGLEPGWMEYTYDFTTKKSWNNARFSFPYWTKSKSVSWIGALEKMGFKLSLWLCMNYDLFVFEEGCADGTMRLSKGKADPSIADDAPSGVWHDDRIEGDADKKKGRKRMGLAQLSDQVAMLQRKFVGRPDGLTGANQDGKEPWFEHLKRFVDRGAQCFKLDGSRQVMTFPGRVWAGKFTDDEVHNIYALVYDKQMAQGYETYTGKRAMVYSAGGYAGLQRYVATWAGDTGGGVKPLVSVMNLGMSGHPNQSCDMSLNPDSMHFGFFAPWSQQNNWDGFHQPWYRDKDEVAVIRAYMNLRYRLFPYIYGTAAEASRTGCPIMRPLVLDYPTVEDYADERGTYKFGDSLLVSAFVDEACIPAGTWFDWRTGEAVTGPAKRKVAKSADWGGSLFVKAGAIIPMWPLKQHLDRGWNDKVEFHVYLGADDAADWYEDDGSTVAYRSGESATARLTLKGDVLTIGARKGSFKGAPAEHDVTVVWHDGAKVTRSELGAVPANRETTVQAK